MESFDTLNQSLTGAKVLSPMEMNNIHFESGERTPLPAQPPKQS